MCISIIHSLSSSNYIAIFLYPSFSQKSLTTKREYESRRNVCGNIILLNAWRKTGYICRT